MVSFLILKLVSFINNLSEAIESQPAAFINVTLYTPPALYWFPFQLKGS